MAHKQWTDLIYTQFKNNINNNNNNNNNINPGSDSIYNTINRIDLTHLVIYSIDPPDCTDADDAFSIYTDSNNLIHLYIHIADPTSYFTPQSYLFKHILNSGQTSYLILPPYITEPNHLFPKSILEKSTLTHGVRNTISVHTILEPILTENNLFEIKSSNIEFSIINAENHNRFTYEEASMEMFKDGTLLLGVEIARFFWLNRKKITNSDFIFSNSLYDFITIPYIKKDSIIMKPDNKFIKCMKSMIAEFAIHANNIFAKSLSSNADNIFFRSISTDKTDLFEVIKNGDSAKYTNLNLPHYLLNMEHYTHATSPLRRSSDCIVHFLLKAQYLNIENPFTVEQLKEMAEHLTQRNKYFKNIQFKEIKLRTFQWIAEKFESSLDSIKLNVRIINYNKPYLNLLITKIDNMNVNISYTLRRNNININIDIDKDYNINISKINLYNKFDENVLPELDKVFIN
jgi:exoribonuclease R